MVFLAISDRVVESLYSTKINPLERSPAAIISCGDLPAEYLDFLMSSFNVPLFYVRGNHQNFVDSGRGGRGRTKIHGSNLHVRSVQFNGLTLAGIEGCIRYNQGNFQYTQFDMWLHAIRLIPSLLKNRLRFGRYLDIFVTHTPPWGVNDQQDPAHYGAKAFRWINRIFRPKYHLHGHIHLYKPGLSSQQLFFDTTVLNVYGHHFLDIP